MQSRRQRERERPFCCSQLLCIRNHNQVQSHRISIILLNCSSPTPPSTPIAACHVNNKYDSDTFISYPAEFHFIPLFPLNVPRSFFLLSSQHAANCNNPPTHILGNNKGRRCIFAGRRICQIFCRAVNALSDHLDHGHSCLCPSASLQLQQLQADDR